MSAEPAGDTTRAEALAQLSAADAVAATDARAALDWILGDAPLASLSRYAVQQFCWYELPFKWIVVPEVRREIVVALARFFDLAGLTRDAELCRSEQTALVLAAWEESPSAGFAAYRRACEASGVEPPNLPELRWRAAMGAEEHAAFWSTAMALELGIDSGAFTPGTRGWREDQAAVARAHLVQPREELFGASHLQTVWTARLADWIEGPIGMPSRARAQLLAPVANALLHPVAPPRGASRSVASLRWFLDLVGADAGLKLTAQGNLPLAAVRAAVEAFPSWWSPAAADERPRRERDVERLVLVHRLADELRLVRRTGRRLRLTRRGDALRHEPRELWRAVAAQQAAGAGLVGAVAELVYAALLVEPLLARAELAAEVTVVLTESGWHRGAAGAPVPAEVLETALAAVLAPAVAFGWVRERGRPATRHLRLTDTGRSTALVALRERALSPSG